MLGGYGFSVAGTFHVPSAPCAVRKKKPSDLVVVAPRHPSGESAAMAAIRKWLEMNDNSFE